MYSKKIIIESTIGKTTAIKYIDKIHQSDKGVVDLYVDLKNQDNTKVMLDETHLVSFMFIDSKNRLHQHIADRFDDGTAILTLPQEVILTGGSVKVEIRFSKEGQILGTNSIQFPIDPTSIKDGLVTGFNPSFDILTKMTELYEAYDNGEFTSNPVVVSTESAKTKAIENALLYYGYPIGFNGLYDRNKVSSAFAKYDVIVFGDTYQKPEQEVYSDTVAVIQMTKEKNNNVQIFGYIPIGALPEITDSNLSMEELKLRVDEWEVAGATGVFLDEFGYDYKVTRERQNEIINYIHSKDMNVIANSWQVEYVFNRQSMYLDWIDFEGNVNGLPPVLDDKDYMLFENAWYYERNNSQAVSFKESYESQTRMYQAYHYYNTIQADGSTYYDTYGTKTFALDAIKKNVPVETAEKMAQTGKLASIIMNMDAYCASSDSWGSNGSYREYNISDFPDLASSIKTSIIAGKNGTGYFNTFERTINGTKLKLEWIQATSNPHIYTSGTHRILVGNELNELKTVFKADLERHVAIEKLKELSISESSNFGNELTPSGNQTFTQTSNSVRIRVPVDTTNYKLIESGRKVNLTFEAMSDVPSLGMDAYVYDSAFDIVGSSEPNVLLETDWKQYSVNMTVQDSLETATNFQLTFAVNTQSTISIRNVSLKEDLSPAYGGKEAIDWDTVDSFIFEKNKIGDFSPQGIINRDDTSGVDSLSDFSYLEVYELYDNLMAQHPDEITKTSLGNDSSGIEMFRYDFSPKKAVVKPSASYKIKTPKILLTSGQHGAERLGVINVYNAVSNIYNHSETSPILENLRLNAYIIVVPMATPWGFDNNTRTNFNGVDLNRNYPHTWSSGTLGSETYGGTEPLNQVESQYISSIIDSEEDLVASIDIHNFFESDNDWENIWMIGTNPLTVNIANAIIRKLNYKWISEKPFLGLSDRSRMVGDIDSPSNGGYLDNYGASKGLVSMTYECQNKSLLATNTNPFSSEIQEIAVEGLVNVIQLCLEKGVELSGE